MPSVKELFAKPWTWQKKGLLITPQKEKWWMRTHTMTPTVDAVSEDIFRVYFCGRDKENRSQIGYATIEAKAGNLRLVEYAKEPSITIGDLGCFDDNGVTPSCVVTVGNKKFFYYIGWNKGATVRMHLFGGLALSDDGGKTFYRYSKAPIIERNRINPLLNTSPFVLYDQGLWRMYYVAGVEWVHKDLPRYNIQYAESKDGYEWQREGHVCIDFASKDEVALARPYVIVEESIYKMWFCHKRETDNYQMGYAESTNGKDWRRCDDLAGISVSESGWDSQMLAYPCIFKQGGYAYLLYNGNNYGAEGAGWAVTKL